MAELMAVGDANFDEAVIKSKLPVLVDFWAPWCAPCRAITPILEDLMKEYKGKACVVKVNVDENPRISSTYSIHSIPTLLLFKEGKPQKQFVGLKVKGKAELKKALDAISQ